MCGFQGAYEASKYNCEIDRWINGLDLKKKKKVWVSGIDLVSIKISVVIETRGVELVI